MLFTLEGLFIMRAGDVSDKSKVAQKLLKMLHSKFEVEPTHCLYSIGDYPRLNLDWSRQPHLPLPNLLLL